MAFGLWMAPTIFGSPLLILPFLMDGSDAIDLVADFWLGYLLIFALPYTAGVALWRYARHLDRTT